MTQNKQDWEELGRNIQDIVDRAVSSQDYQKLSQNIRQTVERAVNTGTRVVQNVKSYQPPKPVEAVPPKPPTPPKATPVLYGKTSGKTAGGVLQIVGGGLITACTLLGSLIGWIASAVAVLAGYGTAGFGTGLPLIFLAAGGGLIYNGIRILNRLSRFKAYCKQLGQKTHGSLEELARSVKKPVKFVKKELKSMIGQGLFLEGHLDKEETMLITSHETYRYFEQSRLQLEQRKLLEAEARQRQQEAAAQRGPLAQEVLDKGNAFLAEIRRCNDAIPGQIVSEKISRMEHIVEQIFLRVEADPQVVPDLKKLMDYYLPMTVKLLNAYADMDAQSVQGETIQASKQEIEATLDTLNLAFEKLLDELFQDTALDVSSDISVLQTMLAQEGLTENEFTKMKRNNGGN
ncbi:MAG: 5-bromo-4-chloroindolyl phosphate hydrolysis family protein [Oscillospiraceae bacterium]|nr:5-bromo-4-chloroindolyl phosphate hydrolysis family protein [Oscillospiraceae bacterium]